MSVLLRTATVLPVLVLTGTAALISVGSEAGAVTGPVDLGTAGAFAVLAGSTVTSTGPTVLRGDLGLSPGTSITGFPPGLVVGGTTHATDGVAAQAQSDASIAFTSAAGRPADTTITSDLAGQTLAPGVHTGGALALSGTLTLVGGPTDVFVLRAASTLVTGSASRVLLLGGASPCHVLWLVGSSATLGTGSALAGTVLAETSITAGTASVVEGRLLARNGAVTLQAAEVTTPTCPALVTATPTASPTVTTSPSATAAPTASAGPTATPGPTSSPPVSSATPSTAPSSTAPPSPAPTSASPSTAPSSSGPSSGPTSPASSPVGPTATASASAAPDSGAPRDGSVTPPVPAPPRPAPGPRSDLDTPSGGTTTDTGTPVPGLPRTGATSAWAGLVGTGAMLLGTLACVAGRRREPALRG